MIQKLPHLHKLIALILNTGVLMSTKSDHVQMTVISCASNLRLLALVIGEIDAISDTIWLQENIMWEVVVLSFLTRENVKDLNAVFGTAWRKLAMILVKRRGLYNTCANYEVLTEPV